MRKQLPFFLNGFYFGNDLVPKTTSQSQPLSSGVKIPEDYCSKIVAVSMLMTNSLTHFYISVVCCWVSKQARIQRRPIGLPTTIASLPGMYCAVGYYMSQKC